MDVSRKDFSDIEDWQVSYASIMRQLRDALSNVSTKNYQKPAKFTTEAVFMICVILLFLIMPVVECFLTILNSAYERKFTRNVPKVWIKRFGKFLDCFCIKTNVTKILDSSAKSPLDFINGIRTILMFEVFIAHIAIFYINAVSYPDEEFEKMIKSPIAQILLDCPIPFKTYFLIGGFFTSLSFCHGYIKQNGRISLLSFYIQRIIRFTPTYLVVFGFYTIFFSYTGSGPLWPNYDTHPLCKRSWKLNLLYLSNFQDFHEQCYPAFWSLGCFIQLHIISPLFLIPLIKSPRIGYVLTCSCILVSCFYSLVQTVRYDLIKKFTAVAFNLPDRESIFKRSLPSIENYTA